MEVEQQVQEVQVLALEIEWERAEDDSSGPRSRRSFAIVAPSSVLQDYGDPRLHPATPGCSDAQKVQESDPLEHLTERMGMLEWDPSGPVPKAAVMVTPPLGLEQQECSESLVELSMLRLETR